MSLIDALHVSGMGAKAQSTRMELSASNLANANTVAGSANEAYRAKQAVFESLITTSSGLNETVNVSEVIESNAAIEKEYAPDHPLADVDGYIYHSNVNRMVELADVITARDSYQANLEMVGSINSLMKETIQVIGEI